MSHHSPSAVIATAISLASHHIPARLRPFLLACLLCLLSLATARADGSLSNLDRDNGLPNAQLGAPLSSFQGLEKTEDLGRFQSYKRPSDALRFGKIPVVGITYNFFKDRLYSVVLNLERRGNVKTMIKTLEQTYGKDHTTDILPVPKTNRDMVVREWTGTRVYGMLKNSTDMDGGELRFIDKPTWDLLEAPRREKRDANKQMLGGNFLNGDLDPKPKPAPTQAPPAPVEAPADPGSTLFPPQQ